MADFAPEILITGSSGLTGSHTLYRLCSANRKVRALVKPGSNYRSRIREVFSWYTSNPDVLLKNVEFFEGDITDVPNLEKAFEGIKKVFHIAALISVRGRDRDSLFKINAEGTANIVNLCLVNDISWLGYVSSVATLGPNPEGLVDEDYFWKYSPGKSNYALSKYSAEQEVWRGIEEGLPAVIINPSVIIGPSTGKTGSASIFYAVKKGLPYFIRGASGYVDVRDVASALIKLEEKNIVGQRFIVSSENLETPVFIEKIAKSLNVKAPKKEAPKLLLKVMLFFNGIASLAGKSPSLTPAVVKMAEAIARYDNSRLKEVIDIEYYSVDEAIENTTKRMFPNASSKG